MIKRTFLRVQTAGRLSFLVGLLSLAVLLGSIGCGGGATNGPTRGGNGGGTGGSQGGASFFSMHINSLGTPYPSASFGGLRLWDTGTGWAQINTAPGTFDFTQLDKWTTEAANHNVDVLYTLARTPQWASNSNDTSCAYFSITGIPGQCHPPSDLNPDGSGSDKAWIDWVAAVSSHAKGKIKFYEIWNEYNVPLFWVGTIEQLVTMTQDAQCVVQGKNCRSGITYSQTATDPAAQIVSPSPVGGNVLLNAVANNTQRFMSAGGGNYVDIIGFHGYVTSHTPGIYPVAEQFVSVAEDLKSVAGVSGKPLFNTEGGFGQIKFDNFTDPDLQAAFVMRYILLQQTEGVDRLYWYRWDSAGTGGTLWSSVNSPGCTTPDQGGFICESGLAYKEAYRWIVGANLAQLCSPNGSIWTCTYTRSGGYQGLVVWDTSQSCSNGSCSTVNFTIPSGATYTEYRDVVGNVTPLAAGTTTVPIGLKPILLETGPLP